MKMFSVIKYVCIITLLFLVTSTVFSQVLVVTKTNVPITIDGSSDDAIWGMIEENLVNNPYVGAPDDEFDSEGRFKMTWDETYLYFICEVNDDVLFEDSDGANEHDESFDLFFDPWLDGGTAPQEDDALITLEWSSSGVCRKSGEKGGFTVFDTTGIVAMCSETFDGYIIEAAIPLADLQMGGGDTFGFDLRINDDDDGGSRDTQVSWYATVLGDWNKPSALAELLLSETVTSVVLNNMALPSHFLLEQNFPNPFNPGTTIEYTLTTYSKVSLKVFDVLGQQVAQLVNDVKPAGQYTINFDASSLNSGIYFCQLQVDNQKMTKRMMLVK